MKILIAHHTCIPVFAYGGTERVVWDLGCALVQLGHKVTYLVPEGSSCSFAEVIPIKKNSNWNAQIPKDTDIVHFQFNPVETIDKPYVITEHGYSLQSDCLPSNTVFLSQKHASLHGSKVYVYNGLDWSSYGHPDLTTFGDYFHFLGKAAWRVKNVQGAIKLAHKANIVLEVLGGKRLNLKRGFRWTLSPNIHFHGMVGGQKKLHLLNHSNGLIFPVQWHEPFGLAVIESLYFGCPVYATPYGALPELVPTTCGALSIHGQHLVETIKTRRVDPKACHAQALQFNHITMANNYLVQYQKILGGETLHPGTLQSCLTPNKIKNLQWNNPQH